MDLSRPVPKFTQQSSQKLEVHFFRSRKIEVTVQQGSSCAVLVERLARQLFLDSSSDYRVFVEEVGFLQPSDVLPSSVRVIALRPAPSRLLFVVDACGEYTSASAELMVDLSSVPREVLPSLRTLVAGRAREPFLMRHSGSGQWLNMSLPFSRQCVEPGAAVTLVAVSTLHKRVLGTFKPQLAGWLQKKKKRAGGVLAARSRRFCILADRCLVYFKSDSPACPAKGVVPVDMYGLSLFDEDASRFRLSNPLQGVALKAEFEFVSEEASGAWVAALLETKNFPRVFAVPWQWHPGAVQEALSLVTDYLADESEALSLPSLFVHPQGSKSEVTWMEELLDSGAAPAVVGQVMRGCDVRSVLALFKRYLNMLPLSLFPASLSTAILRLVKDNAGLDESLAAAVALLMRQSDPSEKPALVKAYKGIVSTVLLFLHRCWQKSKANGATTTMLGRCFGHSLVTLESLSECALVASTLIKLAPLIIKGLDADAVEVAGSKRPEVRWRCTVEIRNPAPQPQQVQEEEVVFLQFPDVSSFIESTVVEDDLGPQSPGNEEDEAVLKQLLTQQKKALTVEERLSAMEEQLRDERKARNLLEARMSQMAEEISALQAALQQQQQQQSTKSPLMVSTQGIQIGRQRSKSNADDSGPELPPRQKGRATGNK